MSRWREEIQRRLAPANLEPAREVEIAQELDQHLEDRYMEMRALGRSEQDARAAALAELDDDIRMREELTRAVPRPAPLPPPGSAAQERAALANWWPDVRYAIRMLRRSPGFTAVAVLTLAVGIGGTVAIFSAVYAVLYKPLPVADADRLVVPISVNQGRDILRASVPYADYADWREQRDVFDAVALFSPRQVDIAGGETPERVEALQVSAEYFSAIPVQPLAGRLLAASDHNADAPRVVVISDRLWKRRFGGDANIAGRDIRIAGSVATVAGIVAADSLWPEETDVWLPLRPSLLDDDARTRRDNMIFLSIARLREGTPIAQARARVAAIAERVARDHAASRRGWTSDLVPLREYVVEPEIRLGMMVLLAGVAFVLLIAAVNLANLLLARGADRTREMALRSALGASRRRLLRQLMTESLVLAAAGGAAGLVLAYWLLQALKGVAPADLPMVDRMGIDGIALAISLGLSVATAVIFGLLPALAASAFQPAEALREGGRTAGSGRRMSRMRDALVVAQMALAIVLLVAAGLMLRSFGHLLRLDPGVDVERILAGRIVVPFARYPEPAMRAQFYERLIDSLRAVPGIESAAATSYLPAGGRGFGLGRVFLLDGQPEPPASTDHGAQWNVVTPGYFRTVGIPVLRGRAFTSQDRAEARPVMIINQTMAARVFGNADPLGKRMRSWRDENILREIVGVVGDVRYSGLADQDQSLVYVPHRQDTWSSLTVAIRARENPAMFAETLRREVARLDPDIAVARVEPLSASAADSIAPQRFGALLLGLFAAAAALLAGIGVYGVMSYNVARRTHELGVRLALGARPRDLFALVVGRGLLLAGAGAVLGLAGALAAGPVMRGLLSGVQPTDPATLLLVPLVLAAVALVACSLPGRRAARVDPIEALRQ
jgi:putative ABC transport system permease protein